MLLPDARTSTKLMAEYLKWLKQESLTALFFTTYHSPACYLKLIVEFNTISSNLEHDIHNVGTFLSSGVVDEW